MLSSPRAIAVDASGNVYIADALGNEVRMVAVGSPSASVTVKPFAIKQIGRISLFAPGVPTGTGTTAQAINLSLAETVNIAAIKNKANYSLSTAPGVNGRVKKIAIRRVVFTASDRSVSIFPASKLQIGKTYRLIIRGQSSSTLTIIFNKSKILSETTT